MFCKECGVKIEEAAVNCPLCHKPLGTRSIFPHVKFTRRKRTASFPLIYLICTLLASIACLLLNIFVFKYAWWSVSVLGVLLYVYVLVAGTIMSQKHTASKIFLQVIAIAVLAVLLEHLTPDFKWAGLYAVPAVLLLGGIILGICALVAKRPGTYVFCLIFVAIAGVIPVLILLGEQEEVLWPSIACAAGCGTMLIATLIWGLLNGKPLVRGELKRKFHA
jgi:hypothetical protein